MRASYWLPRTLLFLFCSRHYLTEQPLKAFFFLAREQQLLYLKSFAYL